MTAVASTVPAVTHDGSTPEQKANGSTPERDAVHQPVFGEIGYNLPLPTTYRVGNSTGSDSD